MDEATSPVVLGVAVETPQHAGLTACLDYQSEQMLAPGTLVRVPLGKRDVPGIVWQAGGEGTAGLELRPVRQALSALPPLSGPWRQLVAFAAAYYQRGLGELALAVLPPELRRLDAVQVDRRLARLTVASPAVCVDGQVPVLAPGPGQGRQRAQRLAHRA